LPPPFQWGYKRFTHPLHFFRYQQGLGLTDSIDHLFLSSSTTFLWAAVPRWKGINTSRGASPNLTTIDIGFMGLDSIELLMEVENYFGIKIPDAEAEKLYTIQTMVDSVAAHLNISNDSMELRDKIFHKVVTGMRELGWTSQKVELRDLISSCIPIINKEGWTALRKSLNLSVPKPELVRSGSTSISDKLKNLLYWTPSYEWETLTVEQFVSAICANNYLELIDRNNIRSKYEIYIAVTGITVDKIGVDYYEIGPDKSFTSDLGID
jgi:acyl carrier protein